ncbi:MAG: FAD-binding domain-containing protein [Pseudomonadota bacterium]
MFVPHAGRRYAAGRNTDGGAGNHTQVSVLSPFIRHRTIAESEVVAAVLASHSPSAAEKFLQEVCWRTYWKGWLEQRPTIWRDYQRTVTDAHDTLSAAQRDDYAAAITGKTGLECFDAWANELIETGYLHNHARMWFASIWIFTLRLPWALGAAFFMRHLFDGDAASNTLSWRWVGGLQTRGKTYLARPDNIARFTEGRFGPVRGLADVAEPLPWVEPPSPRREFVVTPIQKGLRSGLLVTDDDLSPWPALAGEPVVTAALLGSADGVADNVREFVTALSADSAASIEQRLGVAVQAVGDVDSVVAWAVAERLQQVIMPYTPVGRAADCLDGVVERLAEHDVHLANPLRRWDEAAWPHATRGFFPFRKIIPDLLVLASADPT